MVLLSLILILASLSRLVVLALVNPSWTLQRHHQERQQIVTRGRGGQFQNRSFYYHGQQESSYSRSTAFRWVDNNTILHASSSDLTPQQPQQQDDDDCEEECEIDWDQMPGFDNNNDNSDEKSSPSPTTTATNTANESSSIESLRQRLEMSWQLAEAAEECDVFHPTTCGGSPCHVCQTKGRMTCRFCHGRKYNVQLQAVCPVCDEQGTEVCANCRGSGWVADWTALGIRVSSGSNGAGGGTTTAMSHLAP